jgi:hypothetical protein
VEQEDAAEVLRHTVGAALRVIGHERAALRKLRADLASEDDALARLRAQVATDAAARKGVYEEWRKALAARRKRHADDGAALRREEGLLADAERVDCDAALAAGARG